MRAAVLERPGEPLQLRKLPLATPGAGQVLLRVRACGVCRTDLHIADGELTEPKLPLVLGHEIVGEVVGVGEGVNTLAEGDRVGVPWLGWTCGACRYCKRGQENLCARARFTGYTLDGGFAEYTVADARYVFPLPDAYGDVAAAPLLCAGLIGYRTYRLAQEAVGYPLRRIGLYGFGAAAHLLCQLAVADGLEVYAFTREGDTAGQAFALRLGAVWAGGSTERPPETLDAALLFAPVGPLIVEALKSVDKGGAVVSGGIHMSDVPAFPYRLLWEERMICSVANLERRDGDEFLARASDVPIETVTTAYALEEANKALSDLREGRIEGAAVLVP
ncbi:MAG: zinc-dependent alcohol dehydrogenase family protein [Bacteroidetes bacterium]|nr:zinc-dependent alcohol dehydrogenase family protein [Bacteroidota bacterium]